MSTSAVGTRGNHCEYPVAYHGRYHFTPAAHRGAADDLVIYLAAKARRLGLVKRPREQRASPHALLDLTMGLGP